MIPDPLTTLHHLVADAIIREHLRERRGDSTPRRAGTQGAGQRPERRAGGGLAKDATL